MPSGFITLTALDDIYPGDTLWDTGKGAVTGFGARRQAKDRDEQTRGVSYVLKYRFQGRQRMYTIGRHGAPWTPETARKEALRLLGKVAGGEDPADKKAAALAELTVSEWFDVYERDWSKLHKKASTVAEDRRNFKKHIEPEIGKLKLAAVTDQHAVRVPARPPCQRQQDHRPALAHVHGRGVARLPCRAEGPSEPDGGGRALS